MNTEVTAASTTANTAQDDQQRTVVEGIPNEVKSVTQQQAETKWNWAEGVEGTGERPEWLLPKYKTADAQAKAYVEAQKKLGAFTGAPEEYDVGFAKDAKFGEGLDDAKKLMKELGVNQEGFEKLAQFHLQEMEALGELVYNRERELKDLGENANQRISRVDGFLRANLQPDEYSEVRDMLTTANSVKLAEKLIGVTAPKKLPVEGGVNPSGLDEGKLKEMRYAKDAQGNLRMSTDVAYRKQVEAAWADYYGTKPAVSIRG